MVIKINDLTFSRTSRCFYGTKETEWEYCNVPFCAPSTAAALQLAATSGATAFEYPTCETLEKQIYGDVPTATNFTMWKTSTDARNGTVLSPLSVFSL